MRKIVLVWVLASLTAACSAAQKDLKSPCVGAEKSPCDRRPVNDGWLT